MRNANGASDIFSITEKMALKVLESSPEKSSAHPLAIDRATTLAKECVLHRTAKAAQLPCIRCAHFGAATTQLCPPLSAAFSCTTGSS